MTTKAPPGGGGDAMPAPATTADVQVGGLLYKAVVQARTGKREIVRGKEREREVGILREIEGKLTH